jgi:hypothetical protein
MQAVVFLVFLQEVLVPQLYPGHVVLENRKAHTVARVAEVCAGTRVRLLYLL